MNLHHSLKPQIAVALLLSSMWCACTGPSEQEFSDAKQAFEALSAQSIFRATSYERTGTRYPEVPKEEYDCVRQDFNNHIHHGELPSSHGNITPGQHLSIGVKAIRDVIKNMGVCAGPGPVPHGVTVYFGLDANDQFSAVLQFACLTYDPADASYVFPVSRDCYKIGGNGSLTEVTDGLIDWRSSHNDGGHYAEEVVIQPDNSGTWREFAATDVTAIIFPYEGELDSLINDNKLGDADFLEIAPISVPTRRVAQGGGAYDEDGYFNSVCWTAKGKTLDDTEYPGDPYKNKGADLGSPCPPNCPMRKFKFSSTGITPRANCM